MKKRFHYIVPAVLAAFTTFLVYVPALVNGFAGVWDDNAYVAGNPYIRFIDMAFFRWAFFDFYASNWHPLTWISHALDYALWGLNPLGHHLTSVVLHAVNTAIVVLLSLQLLEYAGERTRQKNPASFLNDRTSLVAACVTGLLFGLHPLHVESVAWVSERKDLLCALFYLLSILAYVKYASSQVTGIRGRGSKGNAGGETYEKTSFFNRHYLLALGFFALALLSKPMAVSLPLVLLILDWYPFGRIVSLKTTLFALIEKIPFITLSLASSVLTVLAQKSGESIGSLDLTPISIRLPVAATSLIAYLGKMLVPLGLVPFYPYPQDVSLISFRYIATMVLVVGITSGSFFLRRKQGYWSAVWGSYVVMLIPVLGIVKVGNQAMADRYSYLPSFAPFLLAGLFMAWIAEKVINVRKPKLPGRFACIVAALALFGTLSYETVLQTGIWKNGFVLWDHTIADGFRSPTAYNNRGLALEEMGEHEKARADFDTAVVLDPRNYFAYNNLGVLYGKEGRYRRSIEFFLKAIAINAKHADSYCNLGLSYFNLKQYDRALANYTRAIELKRDFDMAYLNRGNLYFIAGDKEHALADYRRACALGNGKACEAFQLATGA